MNKTFYRIALISISVLLLLVGGYIGLRISNKVEKVPEVQEKVEKVDETTTPVISKTENKDIEVTYEDYYTKCKETITNKNTEYGTTKEKIKEKVDKEYSVVSEDENSIIFRKEIDSNCPNHFELKLENDNVMIYQIVSDGISVIYKNTEISRSNIREELVTELEKGIKVNSLEELNAYIEDIES